MGMIPGIENLKIKKEIDNENYQQAEGANVTAEEENADELYKKAEQDLARYQGVVNNDLENLPTGILLYWVAGLATTSNAGTVQILMIVFTIARLLHTICYAFAIP